MVEQGSQEWHEMRAGKVTASRVKDVIGKTKAGKPLGARETYAREIIAERLTGEVKSFGSAKATDWGKEAEQFAINAYEVERGVLVRKMDFIQHPMIERAGASPDGLVGADGGAEVKSPYNSDVHLKTLEEGMPDEHMPQVQFNLACSGRQWWDFISYDPRMPAPLRLYVERIERDDDYIASMEKEVKIFLTEIELRIQKLYQRFEKQAA